MSDLSPLARQLFRLAFLIEMTQSTIGAHVHDAVLSLERSGASVEEIDGWMRRFARMSRAGRPS